MVTAVANEIFIQSSLFKMTALSLVEDPAILGLDNLV